MLKGQKKDADTIISKKAVGCSVPTMLLSQKAQESLLQMAAVREGALLSEW